MLSAGYLDVHQHLWTAELLDALRRRNAPPMLRGWTLHTGGESPYEVSPADHDVSVRRELDAAAGRVLVSLSSPLGVESLPPDQAAPILTAWHLGVQALPEPFGGWASVSSLEPDLDGLKRLFDDGLYGLQVPATDLASPAALERCAPVLRHCEQLARPVLVHPGPVDRTAPNLPGWWPAVVDYPAQLQAAWWSWVHVGRALLPDLRICFVAGAGLAPLHAERFAARAGARVEPDHRTFAETSSYGRDAVGGLIRVLGRDAIVLGSDRPYASPFSDPDVGAVALHALQVANPARLLNEGPV